jgi:hypothetical protein
MRAADDGTSPNVARSIRFDLQRAVRKHRRVAAIRVPFSANVSFVIAGCSSGSALLSRCDAVSQDFVSENLPEDPDPALI